MYYTPPVSSRRVQRALTWVAVVALATVPVSARQPVAVIPADVAARGLRVERIGVGVVNQSASPPPNEIATAQLVSTQSVRSRL